MKLGITRKTTALILVAIILAVAVGTILYTQIITQPLGSAELKILAVTGDGLQETYGFYDGNYGKYVSNGLTYYRDKFWTESTDNWNALTMYAQISVDPSRKVHGNSSVLFDFNKGHPSPFFYHLSRQYGYLAKDGEKYLYFSIMFNATAQINELAVAISNYGGNSYYSVKFTNISSYSPNEWIRFKIHMNEMTPVNAPSWNDISRLQFNIQQAGVLPLKIWLDDVMMTSDYHYDLALRNLRALFKGVNIDVRSYAQLPSRIDEYTAVVYFDNIINSTGVSIIDQYVNRGGGLVLMGLSTLWNNDGTERLDFPLSSCPVSMLNTTETFIDNAGRVDSFEDHTALKPWSDYEIFAQRGLLGARPYPFLGVAEIYSVSLRADATPLATEGEHIYEATKPYGTGKVIYFSENLAKRIANGMMEAYLPTAHGFGSLGWAGATGDRLQLLESAIDYVSKQPLPKFLTVPSAKNGGFVFTVETSASIYYYSYLNKSCTATGSPSNDTAFWSTVGRMTNQSEETGAVFTLLIATEQLVNENRTGHPEIVFDPLNIEALRRAYQSPNIEIGLSASNIITWTRAQDATSADGSYINMLQGIIDIRNALNLSTYEPLVWRYPNLARSGESMYSTKNAGLYLDVTDESGSSGSPFSDSVAVPYLMEVDTWQLQNRGTFTTGGLLGTRVEGAESFLDREEAYLDWYIENDMIYAVNTNDAAIAADPTHIHESRLGTSDVASKWVQTPAFLKYAGDQSEGTWIVGGVTLAQYFKNWAAAQVTTRYDAQTKTYEFAILDAPDGLTVRLPLNGLHVGNLGVDINYILKERGDFAYVALENPNQSQTLRVTLGVNVFNSATLLDANAMLMYASNTLVPYLFAIEVRPIFACFGNLPRTQEARQR
jgi:hypothetical protein